MKLVCSVSALCFWSVRSIWMSLKHNISVRIKLPATSRRPCEHWPGRCRSCPCRLLLGADDRTHPVTGGKAKFYILKQSGNSTRGKNEYSEHSMCVFMSLFNRCSPEANKHLSGEGFSASSRISIYWCQQASAVWFGAYDLYLNFRCINGSKMTCEVVFMQYLLDEKLLSLHIPTIPAKTCFWCWCEILNLSFIHCVNTPRVTIKTWISIDFLSTEGTIREASLRKSQKQIGLWRMGVLLYISMTINISRNLSGFQEGYCKWITSQWSDNSRDSLEQRLWQATLSLMSRTTGL